MANPQKPDDLNDELLSAYLDDELSAEERARVEERLAADPAARQTLDQLRTVSQAMQGLPRESLGEDLRGAVLQRAERAMLAPASTRPSVQPLPRLTIGRSVRGWLWAGLAVAAALLIMLFQPGQRRDTKLPDIAAARREADQAERRLAHGVPEMRALPEQPAPATASPSDDVAHSSLASAEPTSPATSTPAPAGPPMGSPVVGGALTARTDAGNQLGRELPESEPGSEHASGMVPATRFGGSEASGGAATERQLADERRRELTSPSKSPHASPPPERDGISSEPLPAEEEPSRRANDVLVVHVSVSPAALRSQAFDRLLVSNGIAVERPADQEQPPPASGETSAGAASVLRAGAENEHQPAAPQDVDAVLVEAPAAQIEHCLADLDADKDTYLGVMIDEAAAHDNQAVQGGASQRNWQQYNRGPVPQQQVELGHEWRGAQDRSYYGAAGQPAARNALQYFDFGQNADRSSASGRAMRVRTQQVDGRQVVPQPPLRSLVADEPAGSAGATAKQWPSDKEQAPADTLQVLFVLSSEPAPSPAAGDSVR